MAKAADVVVQCLENEGVEYVFGIPGEENLDLLESLRKSTIRLVLTRHEQSAGFMAATYGRLTGKTGVSLSTLGPGATNLVTAGAYAYLGGMPMLMITGQKPIKKSKQGRFQILDVVGMMQPLTKYTHQLASADNIPSRVREAFRLAEEEKEHLGKLETRYRELLAQDPKLETQPTFLFFKGAANGLFAAGTEELKKGGDDRRALLIGIRCERGSHKFFKRYGERFEESEGKRIFLEFAAEEHDHMELLIREYRSLVARQRGRRDGRRRRSA